MAVYVFNPTVQQNAGYLAPAFSSWAGMEAANGNDGSTTDYLFRMASYSLNPNWTRLYCGYLNFDTSSIPDGATITDVKLRFSSTAKSNTFSYSDHQVNVFSHGKIGVGDDNFENRGSTPYSTAVNYSSVSGALEFTFNASGRSSINKTGVSTMCTREAKYDAGTATPAWEDTQSIYLIGTGTVTLTVTTSEGDTRMKENVGDTWKSISSLKENVGDVWKNLNHLYENVGDVWKQIF